MASRTIRRWLALLAVAVVVSAAWRTMTRKQYEYEEELYLGIDGSATLNINASIASLVALHGADLDPGPGGRPDREQIRALFSAPGATVSRPTFFRRGGRQFVHVSIDVASVNDLQRIGPLAWSTYRFAPSGDGLAFEQTIGPPAASSYRHPAWTGEELVGFRMHVPSEVLFENATSDVQRGNILAWEQPLRDRLAGVPLQLVVRMDRESILYSTMLLFGGTIVAAAALFGVVIWAVVRRGRAQLASDATRT